MRRAAHLITFALAVICFRSTAQDSRYIEVNQLRQNYTRAQEAYLATHRDLETHLLTRPKQQVLREISETEAAARYFTSSQRQYFDRRVQDFNRQVDSLKPGQTAGDARALANQMKTMLDRQMDGLDADQRALQARLNDMKAPGTKQTPEQLLIQDRLAKEVAENDRLLVELSRQSREFAKLPPTEDLEVARKRLMDVYSQLLKNADSQRGLAASEETLLDSYYANLRSVVEKRPNDPTPIAPTQSGGGANPTPGGKPPGVPIAQPPQSNSSPVDPRARSDFKVYFRGTWTMPESREPADPYRCTLKSAEIVLKVVKEDISGSLDWQAQGGGCTLLSTSSGQSNSRTAPIKLEKAHAHDGKQVDLQFFSTKGSQIEGSVHFEMFAEHAANVTVTLSLPASFTFPTQVFTRMPEDRK